MNYLLHRQRSPGAVVPIPDGLEELMGEISREVLRAQPPNVIDFVADYLEEKLVRRENRRLAEQVVDNVLDLSLDIVAMLEAVGIDTERAEAAVRRIREEFHRHFETRPDDERLREVFRERDILERLVQECRFSEAEARKASTIIEQAYRTYYFRNAYRGRQHPPAKDKDWRRAAKHTLSIYAQCGPTREEMETAAGRIQAAYRGYYTRKKQLMDRQAAVIQRAFRSHRNRKQLRDFGEERESEILVHEVLQQSESTGDLESTDTSFSGRAEVCRLIRDTLGHGGDDAGAGLEVTEHRAATVDPDAAATLIQSVFRGHRRRVQAPQPSTSASPVQPMAADSSQADEAATLLQSTVRGHLARKKMQQQETTRRHQMATLLQSHARGYLARKRHRRSRNRTDDAGGF